MLSNQLLEVGEFHVVANYLLSQPIKLNAGERESWRDVKTALWCSVIGYTTGKYILTPVEMLSQLIMTVDYRFASASAEF